MIPTRRCVVCFAKKAKPDLIRIVKPPKTAQFAITIDTSNKKQGRGAYICKSQTCLQNARKKKAFERSFKQSVQSELYVALETLETELLLNEP
ncbi:MAG: YlxR family protein [Firmicutes bacterium]|nr:YlxR family protein [Bacillota bacterium]